jgi:hypothetical protein
LLEWEQPNRFHDWFGSPDFFHGICPPFTLQALTDGPLERPSRFQRSSNEFAPQARGGVIARFKKLHRT